MINVLITSSIMILLLCLVRKVFMGKISRRLQYFLWIFVALRLLVPVQLLENVYNFANVFAPVAETVEEFGEKTVIETAESEVVIGEDEIVKQDENDLMPSLNQEFETVTEEHKGLSLGIEAKKPETNIGDIAKTIWIAGMVVCGVVFVLSNVVFIAKLRKVRFKIRTEDRLNIYQTGLFQTPCLYGFLRPSIYMTEESLKLGEERVRLILAHEKMHYKHLDHIWAIVRSLCLIIYWFDPFVWLAVKLSIRDSELACDESVLVQLDSENRVFYGQTILDLAVGAKSTGILYCTTGISGDKKALKERIVMITEKRKVLIISSVVVAVTVMLLAISAFGGNGNHKMLPNHNGNDSWQGAKEPYKYNSTLIVSELDLHIEDMPNPNMSDGDMLNDFYQPCVFEFEGAGGLFTVVDSEDLSRWIEEREGLEIAHSRLGEYINIYSMIKDFGIEYEDAYSALVHDEIGGLLAVELDLIYSGDEAEIAKYFASDYSIVVDESVYSPYWLYVHLPEDYRKAGISEKMVREKIVYYNQLPLSIEAIHAFETKLSEFLGEEVKFDLGLTEMYWGDIYEGIPEMYTYEFKHDGYDMFLSVEKMEGLEYIICEKYDASVTLEASPDWGIEVMFGEEEKLYFYMSYSPNGYMLDGDAQILENIEIGEAQLKIANAGDGRVCGEYKTGPGSYSGVWLNMKKITWEENKETIIRLIKSNVIN